MKKILSILTLTLLSFICIYAQQSPDRVIVETTSGQLKGFLAERINQIYFDKIDGRVAADVEILSVEEGDAPKLKLAVTRTDDCASYRIGVLPPKAAIYLTNDEMLASYLEYTQSTVYYEDFTNAEMTGFDEPFVPDADYAVATIGYDVYGIACSGSFVKFHTKSIPVVGNPVVEATVVDVQQEQFTIKFEANEDVSEYYLCSFDKATGGLQAQFEQWGPMFGFNTPNEMIAQFAGGSHTGTYTNTWEYMTPSNEYEVWVAIKDANGNFATPTCTPVTTLCYGDDGLSEIEIGVGEFKYEAEAEVYTQQMIYTPNESTNFHRNVLVEKDAIAEAFGDEDGVVEFLKTDQPKNPYWNLYGVDDYPWVVDPETTYVAYAIGQNANGEWGTLSKKEFTTPAAGNNAVKAQKMPKRASVNSTGRSNGVSTPKFMNKKSAAKKTTSLVEK